MSRASALSQLLDKNLCFCKLENIVDQHTLRLELWTTNTFPGSLPSICTKTTFVVTISVTWNSIPKRILDGWYKCSTFPINYSELKCVSNCHYGYNQKPFRLSSVEKKIPLQHFEILENILTSSNDLNKLQFSDWLRWLCPPQLSRDRNLQLIM